MPKTSEIMDAMLAHELHFAIIAIYDNGFDWHIGDQVFWHQFFDMPNVPREDRGNADTASAAVEAAAMRWVEITGPDSAFSVCMKRLGLDI